MTAQDDAETLALTALAWLAGDAELLPAFLAATGADLDALRRLATDPAFLGAVLDFILEADARVIAFCDARNVGYERPMQARAALPGGGHVHWT